MTAEPAQQAQPAKKINKPLWTGLFVFGLLGVLWLGALWCPPQPTTTTERPTTSERVTAGVKSDPDVMAWLAKIVESAGEKCPSAKRIFRQGGGFYVLWNIECSTGESFAIHISDTGRVIVQSCSMLKTVSKFECFKTLREQGLSSPPVF